MEMNLFYSKNKVFIFYALGIILLATCLLVPAFFNGFPILYRDSYHYILAEQSAHHPMYYAILLSGASALLSSLWFNIIFQAIAVALCLFILATEIGYEWRPLNFLAAVTLSSFSTLPMLVSTIMPDVFFVTSFASLLSLAFFTTNTRTIAVSGVIFIFSCITHNIHWAIGIIFSIPLLSYKLLASKGRITPVIFCLSIIITLTSIDYLYRSNKLKATNGLDHFILGTAAEENFLNDALNKLCEKNSLKICAHVGDIPSGTDEFLWGSHNSSMLNIYARGTQDYILAWKNAHNEFSVVRSYLLSNYKTHFLKASLKRMFAMSTSADYMEEVKALSFPQPSFFAVKSNFQHSFQNLMNAKQWRIGELERNYFAILPYTFLAALILVMICTLLDIIKKNKTQAIVGVLALAFYLTSNFTTALISTPIPRYQIMSSSVIFLIAIIRVAFLRQLRLKP